MEENEAAWEHALAVTRPAIQLASPSFLNEIVARCRDAGIQDSVASRDSAPIFDWLVSLISLQGISDAAAFAFDAEHGGVTFAEITAGLASRPPCLRLRSYWDFADCGFRKTAWTCAEPDHLGACPLPVPHLRKGSLNIGAYSLYLFIRDICDGDFVTWIDGRLAGADPGAGARNRAAPMRAAVLEPLTNITGIGPKLWSMMLADLLLGGDLNRAPWVTTGASLIAVDTLVHNFLHRTGTLQRFGAEHPYGAGCYRPGGCAEIIENLARQIDAREFNPGFPATFPRFIQHAIWHFCAASGRKICNGNRIEDGAPCRASFCPNVHCDRLQLIG